MEDELQKRNTDCVYFLASPLTCKKGIECEYRHSEIARLNPRDCWYWLQGSCLNPTCAFRHPPLDGRTETASESAFSHHQSGAPVNKTNFPCYFYYNGFCNKGDRCFYLHGPDDSAPSWKSSKPASTVVDGPSLEKKTNISGNLGPAPVEMHSFETAPKRIAAIKIIPEQDRHLPTSENVAKQNASPQILEFTCDEAAAVRSNSLTRGEDFVHSSSLESTDQSSDNEMDHIEQEEWLESSPGFDVLVSGGAEDLDCEDGAAYLFHHDIEDQKHNDQHLRYDFEENAEYDPTYPDIRISFKGEVQDCYDHLDDEDICTSIRKFPLHARERLFDHTLRQKRKLFQTEDLRDYLKKRRVIGGQYQNYSQIMERPHMVARGHLHRQRLASKVEVYSVGSRIEKKPCFNDTYKTSRDRRYRVNRSRHHFKERRPARQPNPLSEISRKTTPRKQWPAVGATMFTGPKTLAQIKEEKKRALQNGDSSDRRVHQS